MEFLSKILKFSKILFGLIFKGISFTFTNIVSDFYFVLVLLNIKGISFIKTGSQKFRMDGFYGDFFH